MIRASSAHRRASFDFLAHPHAHERASGYTTCMPFSLKRFVVVLCALMTVTTGLVIAQRADTAAGAQETLRFGGLNRTYRLYRPPSLTGTTAVPLVVMLHGAFGTGAQAERSYGWDETADAGRFVVLYPDGIARSWNAGECCGRATARGIDDVGFLTALIKQTIEQQHIDVHRIYVAGMSNGALMTYHLACESSLAFAAIGPVAGTLSPTCRGVHQTSVLAVHGLDDTAIPYNGGLGLQTRDVQFPSVQSTIAWWRKFDHCETPAATTSGLVTTSLSRCLDGRDVDLMTVAGAGHQWPGARPPTPQEQAVLKVLTGRELSTPSTAFSATAKLWQFFAAHVATD